MTSRALLAGAPLAFAVLLMFHPVGGDDFAGLVSDNVTPWLVVHVGAAALFSLMAYLVWLQLRGICGRAATVARVALPVFAVFYGTWEALTGIAAGVLGDEANAASGAARDGVSEAIDRLATDPIAGELGLFNSIGSLAWIVALSAAVVALHGAGVRRSALVLLGLGAMMVMHVPPIGPLALACLSAAGLLIERERRSWMPARGAGKVASATPSALRG